MTALRRLRLASQIATVACAVGALVALSQPVASHSFYDAWCCDDRDCAPLPAGAVRVQPGVGYVVTLAPGEHPIAVDGGTWTMPFSEARPSAYGDYHACILPHWAEEDMTGLRMRCLYVVPGGV